MTYTPSIDFYVDERDEDIDIYHEEDDVEIVQESECPKCMDSGCNYCLMLSY